MYTSAIDECLVSLAGEPQVWADIRDEIKAIGKLSAEELRTTTEARVLRFAHLLEKADIMEKKHQEFQECLKECADDINADTYADIITAYEDYLQSGPSREAVSALKVHVSTLLGLVAEQDGIAESLQDYLVERRKFGSDIVDLMAEVKALRQSNLPLDPDVALGRRVRRLPADARGSVHLGHVRGLLARRPPAGVRLRRPHRQALGRRVGRLSANA